LVEMRSSATRKWATMRLRRRERRMRTSRNQRSKMLVRMRKPKRRLAR
jgi:hypothetical protein